ncbi:MAG: RDD family protein [Halioglobus sp.]|nr:RDD family protein [Halioglobus sp.]
MNIEAFAAPSLLRRLTAMLYDLLLVVAVVAGVFALALLVQVKLLGSADHALHPAVAQALTVASVYGFFIVFWLVDGQTLGMRAWRIKLVDFSGGPPTPGKAVLRCCGATLSAACLGLGYLWCLVDRRNRYWHDYLSRTELILLPPRTRETGEAT